MRITFLQFLIIIVILGLLFAYFTAPPARVQNPSPPTSMDASPYDPTPYIYANKNCLSQYETFMKRNEEQYNKQGELIRTNSGSLPQEARYILGKCLDNPEGLNSAKIGILRNFAFQN